MSAVDKDSVAEHDENPDQKKEESALQQLMAKADFNFKILITEEKFPSCSKMLEVSNENIVKLKIDSCDRVNAEQRADLQKLRDLRIQIRQGFGGEQVIANFDSTLRSILINNERGGI